MEKIAYILKKDCPNIHKEEGDYYNNEYNSTIKELIKKGIIETVKEKDWKETKKPNNYNWKNMPF